MKRVLLIAYPYPDPNMGGVRLRRIARMLPKQGWEVVVLTHPRNRDSVEYREEPGVRVVEVGAPDLTSMYGKLRRAGQPSSVSGPAQPKAMKTGLTSRINRWLMVPDKHIPWRGPAVRRGLELLGQQPFDAIFASLDPRTSLMVAAQLSHKTGVPGILEYRDLWIGNPYHHVTQPTPFHRKLHARIERSTIQQASRVTTVCRGIGTYLSETYGAILKAPVELNYNFFDPNEYPSVEARSGNDQPFTISYTGAMYASRTPHQFFEGMRTFIDTRKLAPHQFRFRWAGGASGIDDLDAVIDRFGVRPYMDFLGMIPHRDALRLMMQSNAALLLQSPDDAIHIPGKLFEALGARTPLLALAHPCEVTEIIQRCRAGIICPHTKESVAAALEQFEARHRKAAPWDFDHDAVQKFSADAAVAKLARLFEAAAS